MRRASEILQNQEFNPLRYSDEQDSSILKAMDEFSKEQCIGMLGWIRENKWEWSDVDGGYWYNTEKGKLIQISDEQLYERFLEDTKNKL